MKILNKAEVFFNDIVKELSSFFYKYRHVIYFIIAFVIIFFIILIFFYFNKIKRNSTFQFLFLDKDGKFEWIGITAIIAIISLTVNAWNSRKKYKADLISKSRIEWLQSVRNDSAAFIGYCILYSEYVSIVQYMPCNVKASPTSDGAQITADVVEKDEKSSYSNDISASDIENVRMNLNLFGNKILLYFPKTSENLKIINKTNEILDIINKEKKLKKEKNNIKEFAIELRKELNTYFKNEWEKAKQGR